MGLFNAIKSQVDIMTVISEYVTLKRTGSYYKGPCPFHRERTPSFTVTPTKEIFYCFSCHRGGDAITFITFAEQCSPREAANHLIEHYHLTISSEYQHELKAPTDARQRHTMLCTIVAQWCHEQLTSHRSASQYLANRGITTTSIKRFELGYMPAGERSRKQLLSHLATEGFLAQDLEKIRFILTGKKGFYSPFENRIIFPIRDHLGRTCGFGGRIFEPGDQRPKYYNSHDHAYFSKGSLLFGFDLARRHVQATECLYVVEGYTDCIAMTQAHMPNTVATLGTACTAEHLTLISRHTTGVCIIYDGDAAGISATLRLGKLCWEHSIDLSVIKLPTGYDPDSYLAQFQSFTAIPTQDIISLYIHSLQEILVNAPLAHKLQKIRELLITINEISDPLKQTILLQKAADKCGIPYATLTREAQYIQSNTKQQTLSPPVAITTQNTPQVKSQKENTVFATSVFYAILNFNEQVLTDDEVVVHALLGDRLGAIFIKSQVYKGSHAEYIFSSFFSELTAEEQGIVQHIMAIQESPSNTHSTRYTLVNVIAQVYRRHWKKTVQDFKKALLAAQKTNDTAGIAAIIEHFQSLKHAMHAKGLL